MPVWTYVEDRPHFYIGLTFKIALLWVEGWNTLRYSTLVTRDSLVAGGSLEP